LRVLYYPATVVASYLIGSIPFAYLTGRLKGVDLREVGSGNLGTSNVFRQVGRAAGAFVFLADCAKMGAVLFVLKLVGFPLWGQALAALAVIAGDDWSAFTGFKGGRGMAVTLTGAGILLPWETLVVLGVLGYLGALGMIAPACAASLALWPMLAAWQSRPVPLVFFAVGAAVLGLGRRLQGSPEVATVQRESTGVLELMFNRLVFDREPSAATERE
jgi:acyl phosphate:glycerol-3-phosphate acyltransferase